MQFVRITHIIYREAKQLMPSRENGDEDSTGSDSNIFNREEEEEEENQNLI
jgi:hypothetical protein